jgi:hypothetical protein
MNSKLSLNTLRRLALAALGAFGVLAILASGGGGGGGGGGSAGGYTGNTSAATITTTNAATLINDVMGTSDPTGGIAAASARQSTSGGQSLSSTRALAKRLETIYQTTISQTRAAGERAMPAFDVDETDPCDSGQGTIHYTGTINNDGTGTVSATYTNCLLDGLTHNGQATLTVTVFDLTFLVPTDFTFTISLLTITGPGTNLNVTGSLRDQLSIGTDTERTTFNLVTTDNVSGKQVKAQNLVFVFVYNNIFAPTSYTLTITGRVYDSVHGYVDVSPVTPFFFASISQLFPSSGQHVLTGAANAHIRVTALSSVLLTVELDLDGDNVYELTAYLHWTDLDGPIGADLGDDDMDGMHNSWEAFYSPPLNPFLDDAADNPDGDGYTNIEEYQAGMDPTLFNP